MGQLQMVHEVQRLVDGQVTELVDGQSAHRHRQQLLPQPPAVAGGTGTLGHQLLQIPFAAVAVGLPIAALQVVQDPLKGLVQGALAPRLVVVEGQLFPLGAVEDDVHDLRRELFHRRVQPEVKLLGQGVKVHPADAVPTDVVPPAGADGAVQNGQLLVGNDNIRIYLHLMPQPSTGGTGSVGVVEGEGAGRQFFDGDAAVLAGVVLAEQQVFVLPHQVDDHNAARELGGNLAAVRQPLGDVRTDDQPVYDDLNVVLDVLLQGDLLGQVK